MSRGDAIANTNGLTINSNGAISVSMGAHFWQQLSSCKNGIAE
jgi:hypothetical protein